MKSIGQPARGGKLAAESRLFVRPRERGDGWASKRGKGGRRRTKKDRPFGKGIYIQKGKVPRTPTPPLFSP